MPVFQVSCNILRSKVTPKFMQSTTDILAKVLNKPRAHVCIHVSSEQQMAFGGSEEPYGFALVTNIGGMAGDKNKELSKVLFKLPKDLDIKGARYDYLMVDNDEADEAG